MLIDLNGMLFHLNIQNLEDSDSFKAEIVDEAFVFGVQRKEVSDLDGVATLIKQYSGMHPRTDTLSQIAQRLQDLYRADRKSALQDKETSPQSQIAAAG